jgi:hypothetical protein
LEIGIGTKKGRYVEALEAAAFVALNVLFTLEKLSDIAANKPPRPRAKTTAIKTPTKAMTAPYSVMLCPSSSVKKLAMDWRSFNIILPGKGTHTRVIPKPQKVVTVPRRTVAAHCGVHTPV